MEHGRRSGSIERIVRAFLDAKITLLLVVAVTLFGLAAVVATPREENPRITVPTAIVTTLAPARSRDEVQRLITIPLERVIGQIEGVEHVYSTSQDGRSTITVRYQVGRDLTQAYVDLYTRLLGNRAVLPADAADPVVTRIDVDDVPVAVLTLSSTAVDEARLREIAYDLADAVAPLPGVGAVTLYGGLARSVNVVVDPQRLHSFGLGFELVDAALSAGGAEQPAGYVADGVRRIDLRAGAAFSGAADVAAAPVALRDGTTIALRDVAGVLAGTEPRESYAWFDRPGAPRAAAVNLAVAKRAGENVVRVAGGVLGAAQAFPLPPGVRLDVTRDDGAKANAAVDELLRRLLEAIAIVSALLFRALRWREALVVATAIPLTLFVTLGSAMLLHQTINRITLFALILSLGLLVDDAIVVIENIHRRAHGTSPEERRSGIVAAVGEVASPTILATLTVILAFLPMAFVTGLMGPYMRPIPLDVPIAMIASLVIAIVVTPWAAVRLVRPRAAHVKLTWQPAYRHLLGRLLDDRGLRRIFLGAVTLVLVLPMALPAVQAVRFRMLPAQNENTFAVDIDEPLGTDLERTRAATAAVEDVLLREPDVRDVEASVGRHGVPDFNGVLRGSFFRDAAWQAELRVNLSDKSERKRASEEIVRDLRGPLAAAGAPFGANVRLVEEPPGPPVRATVHAIVSGTDDVTRRGATRAVESLVRAEPGVVDVDATVRPPQDRIAVRFDLRRAATAGIPAADAAREVAAAFGGVAAGAVRSAGARDPIPVFLRYGDTQRRSVDALGFAAIPGAASAAVPLGDVARLVHTSVPPDAIREDGENVEYVTAEMAGRSSTYAVIDFLLALVHPNTLPAGAHVRWDGEWQLTLDVFRDLGAAMGVAIVLIYLLLVARFASLTVPLVILSAVPLGLIGVLPGFALLAPLGVYFSATAMIGVIALAGIVVRNSIVLVEFVEERLEHGAGLREALIDAGTVRARPIALTAAAGMLSAVVIAADPVWSGLAWALVFGMGTSAVLSLFVVPVLYALAVRRRVAAHASAHTGAPSPHERLQPV